MYRRVRACTAVWAGEAVEHTNSQRLSWQRPPRRMRQASRAVAVAQPIAVCEAKQPAGSHGWHARIADSLSRVPSHPETPPAPTPGGCSHVDDKPGRVAALDLLQLALQPLVLLGISGVVVARDVAGKGNCVAGVVLAREGSSGAGPRARGQPRRPAERAPLQVRRAMVAAHVSKTPAAPKLTYLVIWIILATPGIS
jgi:hypothetical protein